MPRKTKPAQDDRAQARRFIEAARMVGASEDVEDFERALKQVTKRQPKPKGD